MLNVFRFIWNHPLNHKQPCRGILRFLWWQTVSRIWPFPTIIPFVDGTVLVLERNMTGATGNWYCGLHEVADMGFALRFLRPSDTFVDIGANIGSYTVLASGAIGATTLAFEPAAETFPKLMRNVVVNDISERVICHNFGLGAEEASLRFTTGQDTINHISLRDSASDTTEIRVRRLDDILNGEAPHLIKIDVEGWEAQVLKGMPQTLENQKLVAIIVETNQLEERYSNTSAKPNSVQKTLEEYGFTPHTYDPIKKQLIIGTSNQNTIFLRNIDDVIERLNTAPTFKLVTGEF